MAIINGDAGANTLGGSIYDDTIAGLGGDDVLDGGADNDILYGDYNSDDALSAAGSDRLTGGAGADFLAGGRGNDMLDGGDGNDMLLSGIAFHAAWSGTSFGMTYLTRTDGGDDTFNGGTGRDSAYLFYNRAEGIAIDNSNPAAVNTIYSGGVAVGSITGVENLQFWGGDGNDVVTAGDGDYDFLYGGGGNDTLVGGGGRDTLNGGAGYPGSEAPESNDSFDGGEGEDTVDYVGAGAGVTVSLALQGTAQDTSSAGLDTLVAIEDLSGSRYDDILTGDAGANDLSGKGGNDILRGGGGNDYLSADVGDDRLEGGDGDDILSGWTGADTMIGGAGNDMYDVDSAADVITEVADGGADLVWAALTYTLPAHFEDLALSGSTAINGTGNTLANTLTGNDNVNVLDGRGGADTMRGFGGDDWYYVDNAGDVVIENSGQGAADRILASVSYALGAQVYVERLTTNSNAGTAAINLTGNELANLIYGNAGANVLDGSFGADTLVGLGGDDWYVVDNALDSVTEGAADGANDRILASVSYTQGADVHVETLATSNSDATAAINLTGNAMANLVYGNAGANVLNGKAGDDTLSGLGGSDTLIGWLGSDSMAGGTGDDWYYVDSTGDIVIELAGEGSADRILTSVSYTQGAGVHVERLTTDSNAGTSAINLTGNELANVIYGNAGANVLDGKGGADILTGFAGADSFAFTTAIGVGNVDTIDGFSVADDTLLLDDAVFAGLAAGALGAGAFNTGSSASQADDRIVYDSASGALLFDADGLGGAAAVQFATLNAGLALTSADFIVV